MCHYRESKAPRFRYLAQPCRRAKFYMSPLWNPNPNPIIQTCAIVEIMKDIPPRTCHKCAVPSPAAPAKRKNLQPHVGRRHPRGSIGVLVASATTAAPAKRKNPQPHVGRRHTRSSIGVLVASATTAAPTKSKNLQPHVEQQYPPSSIGVPVASATTANALPAFTAPTHSACYDSTNRMDGCPQDRHSTVPGLLPHSDYPLSYQIETQPQQSLTSGIEQISHDNFSRSLWPGSLDPLSIFTANY
jgi:hypothetical protein